MVVCVIQFLRITVPNILPAISSYQWLDKRLYVAELYMDVQGRLVLASAWIRGFFRRGFAGAHRAAAGLG